MASTNKTELLQLNQWVASDPVLMSDFNSDNQKLDAAFAGLPHVVTGTYVGNGEHDVNHKTRLELGFAPVLVIIYTVNGEHCTLGGYPWLRGMTLGRITPNDNYVGLVWDDTGVAWYSPTNSDTQLNGSGASYRYFAVG